MTVSARTLHARGYLAVTIRDRGTVPRGMQKQFNAASTKAWFDVGVYFHQHLRDKRFTEEHARAVGYTRRKGEAIPRGTKAFRKSYTGKKFSAHGHTRPLEFTGETRRAMKTANVDAKTKGVKVKYAGARAFNFRHPKSQIRMTDEFRRLSTEEIQLLADVYDRQLDLYLNESAGTEGG